MAEKSLAKINAFSPLPLATVMVVGFGTIALSAIPLALILFSGKF